MTVPQHYNNWLTIFNEYKPWAAMQKKKKTHDDQKVCDILLYVFLCDINITKGLGQDFIISQAIFI